MSDREVDYLGNTLTGNNNYLYRPQVQPNVTYPPTSVTYPSASVTYPSASVTYPPASVTYPSASVTYPPASVFQCNPLARGIPANFTFPTQTTAISHALPVHTASECRMSRPGTTCLVPGAGVQWQHTPPWISSCQYGNVSAFKGHYTTSTQSSNLISVFSAQPGISTPTAAKPKLSFTTTESFSHSQRRPKRHLELDGAPPSKHLVTDEKMAAHMKSLSITGPAYASNSTESGPAYVTSKSAVSAQWEETMTDRLEEEIGDMEEDTSSSKDQDSRLKINAVIRPEHLKPVSILPKSVLAQLNKSCMQVVLWKPPVFATDNRKLNTVEEVTSSTTSVSRAVNRETISWMDPSRPLCTVTHSASSISFGDRHRSVLHRPTLSTLNSDDDSMEL